MFSQKKGRACFGLTFPFHGCALWCFSALHCMYRRWMGFLSQSQNSVVIWVCSTIIFVVASDFNLRINLEPFSFRYLNL
jgi:hypothetical protein